ncbi:hypothetical protein D3C84_864260 [compost metagenome]
MRAVDSLGLEQQVVERLLEQSLHLGEGPVVTGSDGCGCTHGGFLRRLQGASCRGYPDWESGNSGSGHHNLSCDAVNHKLGTGLHLIIY